MCKELQEQPDVLDKVVDLLYEQMNFMVPLTKVYLKEVLKNAIIFDKKQQDYSSSNIAEFGDIGVLIRMNDKFNRLKNLTLNSKSPKNESIEDTWRDISVYATIGLLCYKGKWPGMDKKIKITVEE